MGCGSSNSIEVVEDNISPSENNINKPSINQVPNLAQIPEINQPNQNINYTPNINNEEKNTLEKPMTLNLENQSRNKINEVQQKDETDTSKLLQTKTKNENIMDDKPTDNNPNFEKNINNVQNNMQFEINNINFNPNQNYRNKNQNYGNQNKNFKNNDDFKEFDKNFEHFDKNFENFDKNFENFENFENFDKNFEHFDKNNNENLGMNNLNSEINNLVNMHINEALNKNNNKNVKYNYNYNEIRNNNKGNNKMNVNININRVVNNHNKVDSHNVINSNNVININKKVNINRNVYIKKDINIDDIDDIDDNFINIKKDIIDKINNFNYDINENEQSNYSYQNSNNDNKSNSNENYYNNEENEEERKRREEERKRREEEEKIRKQKEEEERIRKKKEEEERIKKEKERKKKERKYNTLEEFLKLDEERLKKDEEQLLLQHKSKIDLYKKNQEEQEKKEVKEKEESDNDQQRWKTNQKLGVKFHTSKEIKDFAKDIMFAYDLPVKYDIYPKITSPYNSGKISKETYDDALKYLNSLRFAAGLSYNIGTTDEYNKLAQDASLLCQVNNKLAHVGQPKPKNMNKKLYDSGAKGCKTSNLGMGYPNVIHSIEGWVSDKDEGNFDRMGHRRWVLNPIMKNTGLGLVKYYSGMYSFDRNAEENYVKNVAWPCQHMPIEFFGDNYPWTLSTDENLDKKVTVTIINKKTKAVTKFDSYRNNKFLVNNDGYGQKGCVIFRPNFKYSEGDSYRVDINCTKLSVSYDVSFFRINCTHKKELLGTVNSSCMKRGKKILFCDKCGLFNEPIELEPHDEEVISYTKANCLKKGRKVFECLTCCQKFDYEIEFQPHDYTFKNIAGNSKCEGTCKDCNKKIKITPPTTFNLYWTTLDRPNSYSSEIPRSNPVGSTIVVWVEGVNGDQGYDEIIFEVSDPSLLSLPERIKNDPYNHLKVLGAGTVQLTIYPKYNPNLRKNEYIYLG